MPCGGIDKYADVSPGNCLRCGAPGADHYCHEYDAMLHARCVIPFLLTDQGRVIVAHGHDVHVWFTGASDELVTLSLLNERQQRRP